MVYVGGIDMNIAINLFVLLVVVAVVFLVYIRMRWQVKTPAESGNESRQGKENKNLSTQAESISTSLQSARSAGDVEHASEIRVESKDEIPGDIEVPVPETLNVDYIKSFFVPEEEGIYHRKDTIPDTAWSDLNYVLKDLVKFPIEVQELLDVLSSTDSSAATVSKICTKSVGITAMVLKLVNSSYYGLGRQISDLKEAVTLLGFDEIRQTVITLNLFSMADVANDRFSIHDLFKHSVATSNISHWLSHKTKIAVSASLCSSGSLLSGIGKILLYKWRKGRFVETIKTCKGEGIPLMEAELETLGITHGLANDLLTRLWRLPPTLSRVIKCSTLPEFDQDYPEMVIIYLSGQIVRNYMRLDDGDYVNDKIRDDVREFLNLKEKTVSELADDYFTKYADSIIQELSPIATL